MSEDDLALHVGRLILRDPDTGFNRPILGNIHYSQDERVLDFTIGPDVAEIGSKVQHYHVTIIKRALTMSEGF